MRILLAALFPVFVAALVYVCSPTVFAEMICESCVGNGDTFAPNLSSGTATSFTAVISGNWLASFGILSGNSGTQNEPPWADPFCPSSQTSCPVQVTFNPTANTTTIVYSGNSGLHSNASQGYHFGWETAGCAGSFCAHYIQPLSSGWTYIVGTKEKFAPVAMASVRCACNVATAKKVLVAVVYSEVTFKGGIPFASWNAVTYIPPRTGGQPRIKFANYESRAMYVSNSGILLGITPPTTTEEWYKLLSTMNLSGMPPPGSSGSPFKPLTKPPPKVLKPLPPPAFDDRTDDGD